MESDVDQTGQEITVLRQDTHAAIATAQAKTVRFLWKEIVEKIPAYTMIRRPETGLLMVQGRMGGDGAPFHLGETAVTRCTIRLTDGVLGTGYVLGRSSSQAEIAAVADALVQTKQRELVEEAVVRPLREIRTARKQERAAKVAATRVDFFTMVRGD